MPIAKAAIADNFIFTWEGDALSRRMSEGIRLALEFLAADMVETAQELVHHPGDSQGYATGHLQADISANVPRRDGNTYTIIFGAFNTPYAFWQEILPTPTGRAYIRPAVDKNYGKFWDYLDEFLADHGGRFFATTRDQGITDQ